MDGIKSAGKQLRLVKSDARSSNAASTPAKAQSSVETSARSTSSSATIISLSLQTKDGVSKSNGAIRDYDEAKDLARDVAERVKGDEHELVTADGVRGLLTTN